MPRHVKDAARRRCASAEEFRRRRGSRRAFRDPYRGLERAGEYRFRSGTRAGLHGQAQDHQDKERFFCGILTQAEWVGRDEHYTDTEKYFVHREGLHARQRSKNPHCRTLLTEPTAHDSEELWLAAEQRRQDLDSHVMRLATRQDQ